MQSCAFPEECEAVEESVAFFESPCTCVDGDATTTEWCNGAAGSTVCGAAACLLIINEEPAKMKE